MIGSLNRMPEILKFWGRSDLTGPKDLAGPKKLTGPKKLVDQKAGQKKTMNVLLKVFFWVFPPFGSFVTKWCENLNSPSRQVDDPDRPFIFHAEIVSRLLDSSLAILVELLCAPWISLLKDIAQLGVISSGTTVPAGC